MKSKQILETVEFETSQLKKSYVGVLDISKPVTQTHFAEYNNIYPRVEEDTRPLTSISRFSLVATFNFELKQRTMLVTVNQPTGNKTTV